MKVTKMKKNKTLVFITLSLLLSVFVVTSCRDAVKETPPTGPSSFAILLSLNANPNVLFAGLTTRQISVITASLKKYDGTPLSGQTIYFEIVNGNGAKVDLGYFEGYLSLQSKVTDGSGATSVNYYGPLSGEIAADGYLYIRATAAGQGSQFIIEKTPVYFVRDTD
jgi:hypothetical protein